ncbi:MAG: SirB2 family protein [Vibrionaceae bacterium]
MYLVLKNSHLLLASLSVGLFVVRFLSQQLGGKMGAQPAVRRTVHIIDGLFLLSGVALMLAGAVNPFSQEGNWLLQKLLCVVCYIALGYMAMHYNIKNEQSVLDPLRRAHIARTGALFRWFSFIGALGWIYLAVLQAATKTSYF